MVIQQKRPASCGRRLSGMIGRHCARGGQHVTALTSPADGQNPTNNKTDEVTLPTENALGVAVPSFFIFMTFIPGGLFFFVYIIFAIRPHQMSSGLPQDACGFEGNPDVYGIGIRVGFYTQALAAWCASFFLASEARGLQTTNRLFMLAIGVVIIWYGATPGPSSYAAELWSICLIASCIKVVSQQRLTRYSSRYVPFSLTQMGVTRALTLGETVYGSWFWWQGLEELQPTPCGTYIFFFAKLDIYGGFRIFAKVWCGISALQALSNLASFGHYVKLYFRHRGTKRSFVLTMKMTKSTMQQANNHVHTGSWESLATCKNAIRSKGRVAESLRIVASKDPSQSSLVGTSLPTDVLDAERYLREVFDLSRTDHSQSQLVCNVSTCIKGMRVMSTLFWTHPQLTGVWDVLALHFESIRCKYTQVYPLILRMVEMHAQGKTPDFRILQIASDVHLSQLPLYTSHGWMLEAIFSLGIIIFSILGIELTIAFNQISGLNSIFSVGQLIPFVIGTGGLVQVLWRKWRAISKNIPEEKELSASTKYEEALDIYINWRRGQMPVRHETI